MGQKYVTVALCIVAETMTQASAKLNEVEIWHVVYPRIHSRINDTDPRSSAVHNPVFWHRYGCVCYQLWRRVQIIFPANRLTCDGPSTLPTVRRPGSTLPGVCRKTVIALFSSAAYSVVVCASACRSVPSIDRCMALRRVCCCGPGGHEIAVSSKGEQCHVVSKRR